MKTVLKIIGAIILFLFGWFLVRFTQEVIARKKADSKPADEKPANS